jgi:dethiobiotin synthetase
MRGLFVTGTDTGVGKSVVSAALVAAMRAAGEPVAACKPVLTGLDEPPESGWPRDDELLASAAATDASEVTTLRFGPAVSPHLAAELAGTPIDAASLGSHARSLARDGAATLVVEGVGGLLVPLADGFDVRDLAARLALPLVIAARPGLGTINHSLLTLEAARSAGLDVAAVVITPWPTSPSTMERSNRDTIQRLGGVETATLPTVASPLPEALARAGQALPWRRWLDRG